MRILVLDEVKPLLKSSESKTYLIDLTESSFAQKVQESITMIQYLKIVKTRTIFIPYAF